MWHNPLRIWQNQLGSRAGGRGVPGARGWSPKAGVHYIQSTPISNFPHFQPLPKGISVLNKQSADDLGNADSLLINSLPYETWVAAVELLRLGVFSPEQIAERLGVTLAYAQSASRVFDEWFGDGGVIDRAREILIDDDHA